MLPLISYFKAHAMKNAQLLTVAFGILACTHPHSDTVACFKDSTLSNGLSRNTPVIPVVNVRKPAVKIAPQLPFFKDVLDSKRLFW